MIFQSGPDFRRFRFDAVRPGIAGGRSGRARLLHRRFEVSSDSGRSRENVHIRPERHPFVNGKVVLNLDAVSDARARADHDHVVSRHAHQAARERGKNRQGRGAI